jgi:phosphoribosylformylglycinamidine cyclo-ligase
LTLTYEKSGVSISQGDNFVHEIKKYVRSTYTRGVIGDIGAFGGFFNGRFQRMRDPVLVSSVDGVGTKLLVAQMMKRHDTVGQDLVNHCVNDILVCGATPLFFLDYYSTGRLNIATAAEVIKGFSLACRQNGCALIGGETAEMPGLYSGEEYDLSGTIVGVVDRKQIVDGRNIRKGDVMIGLPSTGLHTNGFSLARAALLTEFSVNEHIDELGTTVGEALLAVHRSYLGIVRELRKKIEVRGLSHITGGGIVGNTMRIVPRGRSMAVDWNGWQRPEIFRLIQRTGDVPEEDMRRTFNLGIGLVAIVAKSDADAAIRYLRVRKEHPVVIGHIA